MARTNTKANKKNDVSKNVRGYIEECTTSLVCKVTKIFRENDKCVAFGIDTMNITKNDKIGHAWLSAICFEDFEINENEFYIFDGYFSSSEYNGKWSINFIVTGAEKIEE